MQKRLKLRKRLCRNNVENASKKNADDYVIATNKSYSIKYFVNQCCNI